MWYAIFCRDTPDSLAARVQHRPAHLARLQQLLQEGRLLLAGPHPAVDREDPGDAGFSGSLIVAEFENLQEAQKWADNDPFAQAGIYAGVEVKPFRKTLP